MNDKTILEMYPNIDEELDELHGDFYARVIAEKGTNKDYIRILMAWIAKLNARTEDCLSVATTDNERKDIIRNHFRNTDKYKRRTLRALDLGDFNKRT